MKFSIVTPSYNQAGFLRDTIESVLTQDEQDIEYIIMDGGSTDGSAEVIREYEPRLKYCCSRPDKGQADAINEGFSMSSGDVLGWINSDDMLMPGALNYVAEVFQENPEVRFMYGGCEIIDESGNHSKYLIEPYYNEKWQIYIRSCVPQPSAFWRRDLYFEVGGLDTSLHYAMDYDLWFKFCAVTSPFVTKRILSRQRMHTNTKTLSEPAALERDKEQVRQRYFTLPPYSSRQVRRIIWRMHRILKKGVTGCYFGSAGPRQ